MRKTLNNVNLTDVTLFSEFDTILKCDETTSTITESVTGETFTAPSFAAITNGIQLNTGASGTTLALPDLSGLDFAAWVCADDAADISFGTVGANARITMSLNAATNAFRVNSDNAVDPVPYIDSTATGGLGGVQKALLIFRQGSATGCAAHVSTIGSKLIQVGVPVTTVGVGNINLSTNKLIMSGGGFTTTGDFYMAGIKSWAAGTMPTNAQLILQADWEMERAYAGYKEFYPPALYL